MNLNDDNEDDDLFGRPINVNQNYDEGNHAVSISSWQAYTLLSFYEGCVTQSNIFFARRPEAPKS